MKIDYLQRNKDLNNLLTVIDNLSRLKSNATFALNGQWGCGKTFLLNMLEDKLNSITKDSNTDSRYSIVRYDCWKNNYYSEPIIPMLSAFISKTDPESQSAVNGFREAIIDSASKYIGLMLKNTIGINLIEIKDNIEKHIEEQQSAVFAFDNILALKQSLADVKKNLEELAEHQTIIFIVDELDRCLPEYSIRVLENIHHIFSGIDNFITILAIDQTELAQVIKTAYGSDIDVSAYLKKIIDFYVQLDFGNPDSDYWDKYSSFTKRFTGTSDSQKWCHDIMPELMANLDIRTQEKIWKKAELLHNMITIDPIDFSCLIYELIVLIQKYYRGKSQAQLSRETLEKSLKKYSTSPTSSVLRGKSYPELNDHPSGRIIWFQEGWELWENPHLQSGNPHIRIRHACTYADTIQKDDELMQKFAQLSLIID